MRTSRGNGATRLRHRARSARKESGVVMMFVLMAMVLIGAITLTVIQLINADMAGGLRELQADQVFNIAQAGVHYAIGKLQTSGANAYAGETTTITNGATPLGTATITVNCIDTGAAPPCTGAYAGYRRILSTGSLPVPGPSRTVVAVVQGTAGGQYGVCGLSQVVIIESNNIHSDVGSNGTISIGEGSIVYADTSSPPQYSGTGRAISTISCGSGCGSKFQGGAFPGSPSPVCPTVTLPPFSGTGADLTVTSTYTMNGSTGYNWRNVTVTGADLMIQADPSNPNATTVVNVNTLTLTESTNARVIILGVGKVELRIAQATGNSLLIGENTRLGALSSDTPGSPAPVPAGRFIVYVNSSAMGDETSSAVFADEARYFSATLIVPNGKISLKEVLGTMYGFILANIVWFEEADTFYADTSGAPNSFTNFTNLRSWKDQ
jgi:Tfp pilus assembly protein PilX